VENDFCYITWEMSIMGEDMPKKEKREEIQIKFPLFLR
jgi:hypothetical protein